MTNLKARVMLVSLHGLQQLLAHLSLLVPVTVGLLAIEYIRKAYLILIYNVAGLLLFTQKPPSSPI